MTTIDHTGPRARDHRSPPASARRNPILRHWWLLAGLAGAAAAFGLAAGGRGESPDARAPSAYLDGTPEVVGEELPLHVNDRVRRWMHRFQTDQRREFARLLSQRGVYADLIRDKLRRRGMPEELLYMAMMESGLSPWATSSAAAVGVWQFMGPTAEQYGLRVDEWVDERRDPVRATDAALDYLQWLHERYGGSWYLAAAAYNAGPGRLDRVLHRYAEGRSGEEDLYWEVLEHLPGETREYVPRLIAATLLAEEPVKYGFTVEAAEPYRFDRVIVPGGTSLARIARTMDVSPRVLRDLNPHLVRGVTPPGEAYPVRVPVGASPLVVASLGPKTRSGRAVD